MMEYGDRIAKLGEETPCAYELFDRGIERKRTTFKLWLRDCLPETRIQLAELMVFSLTGSSSINFEKESICKTRYFTAIYNSSTFGMKEGMYVCILEIRFNQKRNHAKMEKTIKEVFESFIEEIDKVE